MGQSHGDFVKYPRTPHLFGSRGTDDDKHLNATRSIEFIDDNSLIVEEKLDGTNVGIHFSNRQMVLQCRGHEIRAGMHPQYDLFKQWATVKRNTLEACLQERFIMYGEWLFARHCVYYKQLSHYFFEFDVWDKREKIFLDLTSRTALLSGTGIETVPVVHQGRIGRKGLFELIGDSVFDSEFEHPETQRSDKLMEGLYLRTEENGVVTGRAKFVRPEFTEKIKQSAHWQYEVMVQNQLRNDVDIFA